MLKELENLVYTNYEQMMNTNTTATVKTNNNVIINAKVVEGNDLEKIFGEKVILR